MFDRFDFDMEEPKKDGYPTEGRGDARRTLLVGVRLPKDFLFENSMKELEGLAGALSLDVRGEVTQSLPAPDKATCLGSGKVEELKTLIEAAEADLVVVNNTLTPSQLTNLADALEVEVIDRTNLILNIFAERARTGEAKMQVDYAKLRYMLPRLVGLRKNLSRQGGTGGSMSNKGAGETQIELDRRRIQDRMAELRRGLKELEKVRATQRSRRERSGVPLVALVGYTNAGKSTLMNLMLDTWCPDPEKRVEAKDMLFATLDTSVRRITPPDHRDFLLSDTVGFINDLPTELVTAFRSTLEEALYADLILQVVDCSDENHLVHMAVTENTLKELGAGAIPMITVMNKADRLHPEAELPFVRGERIYMAAGRGIGLDALLAMIEERLFARFITAKLLVPYAESGQENSIRKDAQVRSCEYRDDGIFLTVSIDSDMLKKYERYLVW